MRIIKKTIIHLGIIISMSLLLILFLYHPIPTVDHIDLYEDQIDAQIVEMMERYDIPGVQLTLFDHEDQVHKTFGYKDFNNMNLIDDQTVFRAQSLSKTVTAVLILKMVENNQIELDAQLKDLVSESFISKIPDIFHDVTIHQILKHEAYMPLGDFNRMFDINDQSMMSLEEALIYDLNQKRPNGGYFYSNVGYNLLEYIINQVDEDGYEYLAETYVFEPLEMNHTSFSYDDIDLDDLAFGYDQYKNRIDHYRYPELGSGGLLSTSSDYYKFLYGLIHGEIIDNEHVNLLLTFDPDISLGSYGLAFDGYGYGVFVESMGESVTFAHGGQGLGFMAFYHIDLKNQSGYVVMSNSQRTYPLISMLSTMLNDAYDLDAPGIKNIHTLMIIFEILIAITLYVILYLVYLMMNKKRIKHNISFVLLSFIWVLSTFGFIYFMFGNYMFIHVLIPLHFEILMRICLIFSLSLLAFIIESFKERGHSDQNEKESLKSKISQIKKDITIIGLAFKDQRTSWLVKTVSILTIGYALSPIDFIPDFIPVIGYLDDIIILPLMIKLSLKLIPSEVLAYAKQHYENHINEYTKKQWIYGLPFLVLWIYIVYAIIAWVFVS